MKTKTKNVKARKMILRHSKIDGYHEYSLHPDATDAHIQEVADRAVNRAVIVSAVQILPADAASYDKMVEQIRKEMDDYAKPRPFCRDCADNDGTCPASGLPCDPDEARAFIALAAIGINRPETKA